MKGILMIAVMIGLFFLSFLTTIAWAKDNCTTELNTCTTNLNNAQTSLNNAQTNLGTCDTNLSIAQSTSATCQANLGACNTNLGTCQTNALAGLSTCQANLATCQANVAECSQEAPPTSWDQQLACDSTSNCPRFEVLSAFNNAAVLDKETGLVWEQTPSTAPWAMAGGSALWHCISATTGNRMGWRLPTIQELMSLLIPNNISAGLPPGHPFSLSTDSDATYLSATMSQAQPTYVWAPQIFTGEATLAADSFLGLVWCVRGGQVINPQ
ncbi:MAG: DUF1566 domain-containing protein [Dissulfurispiraceae bacterium]